MKIQEMSARLDGLVVFRGILRDPVVERLRDGACCGGV